MFGMGDRDYSDVSEYHRDAQNAYQESQRHEGKLSHELLAGAGSFMAMRAFEQRMENEGKPQSHEFAKELLAGIVGGEVDKLAETKGMDAMDAMRAKERAKQQAFNMYDAQYGNQQY